MRSDTRQAGFTLIEVLVVLAILGAAAGLIMARGGGRSGGLELRAAAATVQQSLQFARGRAIAQNRPVRVVFDTAASRLQIDGSRPQALPPAIALTVTATADQSAGAVASIQFMPDGSASGGTVLLAWQGRTMLVAVSWLTGRVTAGGV